jgi:hypothetical protein
MFVYMVLRPSFAKTRARSARGGRAMLEVAGKGLACFRRLHREQTDGAEDETAAELPEETRLYDTAHDAIPMNSNDDTDLMDRRQLRTGMSWRYRPTTMSFLETLD